MQAQMQMTDQNYNNQKEKVIIHEQDFDSLQLVIYTTKLKMQGKEVIIENADGKQYPV
ncbi:MAG: hypothetical protein GY718_09185 [Lentisphaerae bacterium]|nr:hypothetical protein [Lentisphaerota bacterium]